jgi:hypothetical protein
VDPLERRISFDALHEEFTALQAEHDNLSRRPYNAADHERHRARLRAFVEALYDWHQAYDAQLADMLKSQS